MRPSFFFSLSYTLNCEQTLSVPARRQKKKKKKGGGGKRREGIEH